MNSQARFRLGPIAAGVLLLAVLLVAPTACATSGYDAEAASLSSYAEKDGGLVLRLARDGSLVWGAWEDLSAKRFGLVEGEARPDGGLSLKLFGESASAPPATLEGRYAAGEGRVEGKLAGGDASRDVVLPRSAAPAKLALSRLHAEERGSLAAEAEPTRFDYTSIEPAAPKEFLDWYRKTFQGGMDSGAAMAREKDAFFEDFRSGSQALLEAAGQEAVHPWFYDGRQFLAYANPSVLVLGLRRATFAGGAHGMHGVRYAIIDPEEPRILGPADLFVPGCDEALSGLLGAKAREAFGLEPGSSLSQGGFLVEAIPPTNNMFVYSGGIGFHYNVYEVAPYAAGDIWLCLPFEELGGVLLPGAAERLGFPAGKEGAKP